jgi:hypothetical protein
MGIKNILLIQPVFAPDVAQTQRNVDSIRSLGTYLRTHTTDGFNLMIIMGGWAKSDDLWNLIASEGKAQFGPSFNPIRFDKNYGKAYVVNTLYKNVIAQNNNVDALMSADSDIIFTLDTPHLFTRLVVAAEKMVEVKKQPWGLIGLNQLQHGCHFKSCYENQVEYEVSIRDKQFKEKIVWPSITSGIAGGCLFINRQYWDKVGGYDVERAKVYGPDDAYLLYFCGPNGFSWQMSDSIGIVHPFDNNKEYSEWKVRNMSKGCTQSTRKT